MRFDRDSTPELLAVSSILLMKMSAGNLLWSVVLQFFISVRNSDQRWPSVARHPGYALSMDQSVSVLSSQAVIVVSAVSDASLGPLKPLMWRSKFLLWTTGPLNVFCLIFSMRRETRGIRSIISPSASRT